MAIIPLPERGQPLDVAYISRLAQAVNDLSKETQSSRYNYVSIATKDAGPQNKKVTDVRVITKIEKVGTSGQTVNTGDEIKFDVNFAGEFKFAPVVTATVVNAGGTPAGNNTSLILNEATTSGVSGAVKFNAPGVQTTNVNLIIVGVPN
jgi:hypothetical protein